MTLCDYHDKFYDELRDSQPDGVGWSVWVHRCHGEFLDSVAEQELNMELNQL